MTYIRDIYLKTHAQKDCFINIKKYSSSYFVDKIGHMDGQTARQMDVQTDGHTGNGDIPSVLGL